MTPKKILLRGPFVQIELPADAHIMPGMLCESTATGVKPHATSVGFAERMFAMEDALQGRTTEDDYKTAAENQTTLDDTSAKADPVQLAICSPGALVAARCKTGTNYTLGLQVFSYGDGTLRSTTGTPKQLIGVVAEATDLSDSDTGDALVVIRLA